MLGAVVALASALVLSRTQAAALAAPAGLRITFLDVGQGDATLLQGGAARSSSTPGRRTARSSRVCATPACGGSTLLVVTHAQADHDGGAAAVLGALPVALVLDGRDGVATPRGARWRRGRAARACALVAARAGEVLRVGGVALRVLWPAARGRAEPARTPTSARSSPRRRRRGATLLTADAESDVLARPGPAAGRRPQGRPPRQRRPGPARAAGPAAPAPGGDRGRAPATPTATRPRRRSRALRAAGAAVVRTDRDGTRARRAARPARCASTRTPRLGAVPAFKPAYLIHGDDHGRIGERRARLRAMAEAESGSGGFEVFEGDASTPEAVALALNAMTFAIGRRFLIVDGVERWRDADVEATLAPVARRDAARHDGQLLRARGRARRRRRPSSRPRSRRPAGTSPSRRR